MECSCLSQTEDADALGSYYEATTTWLMQLKRVNKVNQLLTFSSRTRKVHSFIRNLVSFIEFIFSSYVKVQVI